MKKIILVILSLPTFCLATAKNKSTKEVVHLNGSKVTVETNESGSLIVIWKGKKKNAEFNDRNCMRSVVSAGEKRLKNAFLSIVRIDGGTIDYLYCVEEIDMYSYQGLLIGPGEKGKFKIIYSGPARGSLEDYNGDGLMDFMKTGGIGEPVSDTTGAYDPYLVFKQVRDGKEITFKIDEALSEKFSNSKGFQWHGSKYSEAIIVDNTGKSVQ